MAIILRPPAGAGATGPTGPTGATGAAGATGPAGPGHTIQEEGSNLTARTKLNFIGTGVTATDNSGADSTDVTVTANANPVPADAGLLAWAFDVSLCQLQTNPSAGTLYIVKCPVRVTTTFGSAAVAVGIAGSGGTPLATCFLGLYDAAGTLRGKSADQTTPFQSTGGKIPTLTAEAGQNLTIAAADGYAWAAILIGQQATTPMQLRTGSQVLASTNLLLTQSTTPPARYLSKGAVGTALPSTITVSTFTAATAAWWAGLGA